MIAEKTMFPVVFKHQMDSLNKSDKPPTSLTLNLFYLVVPFVFHAITHLPSCPLSVK